jgi:hypothetical protein
MLLYSDRSPMKRVTVTGLVDNQSPVPASGLRRSKVLEVEGQDWEPVALRVGHHRSVDDPEVEIGEPLVELGGTPQNGRREVCDSVLSVDQRAHEQPSRVHPHPGPKQMIDFDDDGIRNDQISPEFRHQRRGQSMSLVAHIRSRDERPGIGNDVQRDETGSRR